LCGSTLAQAHARTGDRVAVAAYLGKSDAFDRALAAFAAAHADLNERDHEALARAVRDGRWLRPKGCDVRCHGSQACSGSEIVRQMLQRLRDNLARWKAASDREAVEQAEEAQRDSLADEDFEGRKDDVRTEELFPGTRE
jgi:Uncharacterized protein conserved in bacteria (DUF2252)